MKTEQKKLAVNCLTDLGVYKPYIKKFKEEGIVTLFERFAGFYITEDQEPELFEYIKKFEEETGSLVYAVTHEYFSFGECYTCLCISKYEEDWPFCTNGIKRGLAWSWVWNKTADYCSEYGTVGIKSFGGGLMRPY